MAKNALDTIRLEANRIRAKHPKMSYQSALKKAGREYRQGAVSGTKRKKRTAKRKTVGSSKQKYKCFHEVRRVSGISYTGGRVSIKGTGQTSELRDSLKGRIGQEIGWLEVAKSSAKTARERHALQKKISEKKAELRRLS
jgi:hypothetical protein